MEDVKKLAETTERNSNAETANKIVDVPNNQPQEDEPLEELNKLKEEPLSESDLPPGMKMLDGDDTANADGAEAL